MCSPRNELSLANGILYGGWCGRPALWDSEAGNLGDQDILLSTHESRAVADATNPGPFFVQPLMG